METLITDMLDLAASIPEKSHFIQSPSCLVINRKGHGQVDSFVRGKTPCD